MTPFRTVLTILMLSAPIVSCAPTETSESTGEFLDDVVITTKVKNAIVRDPTLKVLQIQVETYKNTVQLSGFVDTQVMISRAGEVAGHVEGVITVQNNLLVK